MQKIEVKINVKTVFKCVKPVVTHVYGRDTNPTNTQDPTLTLNTINTENSIISTLLARS